MKPGTPFRAPPPPPPPRKRLPPPRPPISVKATHAARPGRPS